MRIRTRDRKNTIIQNMEEKFADSGWMACAKKVHSASFCIKLILPKCLPVRRDPDATVEPVLWNPAPLSTLPKRVDAEITTRVSAPLAIGVPMSTWRKRLLRPNGVRISFLLKHAKSQPITKKLRAPSLLNTVGVPSLKCAILYTSNENIFQTNGHRIASLYTWISKSFLHRSFSWNRCLCHGSHNSACKSQCSTCHICSCRKCLLEWFVV